MGASQIQLIPVSELAPGQIGAIRNEIIKRVLQEASRKLNLAPERFVVRDIRPMDDLDFSLASWYEGTGVTANAYETMSTGTMGDQRWVAIYGVKDNSESPTCSLIKFNIGGADRCIWQLQALNEDDGKVGICPMGIVIPENDPYTISRYVLVASQSTQLVLKGLVIEPRGRVLSP